ncbi:MAG: prephenate dehydrogenase/arogenate dehydrogenase family protein [Chloroflexi bacterium]|nr:prephenate dehydrogenase/arogenate dehydrogenase family protein [Chloroflexota bacterium]
MSLTIIGLSQIPASLGLAIKNAYPNLTVVGHDPDTDLSAQAKKMGAVDRTHWNLPASCEGSDIVLVAVSFAQLELTLSSIAESLAENTLLVILTPLSQATWDALSAQLPTHLRILRARLVPVRTPEAEPLNGAALFIAAAPESSETGLRTVAKLAEGIGAKPRFCAPEEFDSLLAACEQLPAVVSLALLSVWQDPAGWPDRSLALGEMAEWAREFADDLPEASVGALTENNVHLDAWLARTITELQLWRARLQQGEQELIDKELTRLRSSNTPDNQSQEPDEPEGLGLQSMIMGRLIRRARRVRQGEQK